MLDAFALLVLLVVTAAAIWLLVQIASIPGKLARAAGHPQAEAINCLAWIGLLTAGVGWFIALVWAKTAPAESRDELERRLRDLEQQVARMGGQP